MVLFDLDDPSESGLMQSGAGPRLSESWVMLANAAGRLGGEETEPTGRDFYHRLREFTPNSVIDVVRCSLNPIVKKSFSYLWKVKEMI